MTGGILRLDPSERLTSQIYVEEFESEERRFVKALLRRGDVVFDVGANAGLFTVSFAASVGPTGHVYAFEPTREVFLLLQQNVAANQYDTWTQCLDIGLSDMPQRLPLHANTQGYAAWNSFGARPAPTVSDMEIAEVDTIDRLLECGRVSRPWFVKLDVEGWETRVIRGGIGLLGADDAPHLLVEFSEVDAAGAGSSTRDLYDMLASMGFVLFRLEDGDLVPEPRRNEWTHANLVATKRPAEIEARLRDAAARGI